MSSDLLCWKCGAGLGDLPLPLARLAECLTCNTELHVCRMCKLYDPKVAKSCREPIAEEVKDKDRANFCDYFNASALAFQPVSDSESRAARSELDSLFGLNSSHDNASPAGADAARDRLSRLFDTDDEDDA